MTTLNKPDLLTAMAAHVRGTGLAGASLRPLARAAGTSDRMLIYHFGSKGALIGALLDHLSVEMLSAMSAALPEPRAETEAACAAEIVALLRTPTFRPTCGSGSTSSRPPDGARATISRPPSASCRAR